MYSSRQNELLPGALRAVDEKLMNINFIIKLHGFDFEIDVNLESSWNQSDI